MVLAKTGQGYGMGGAGEGQNSTHQQRKMGYDALGAFRDRVNIPISDDEFAEAPFYKPAEDSPEIQYMHERRRSLGGDLPMRRTDAAPLDVPGLEVFEQLSLTVVRWVRDLHLYPWPASCGLDRSLHFLACLDVPAARDP